MHSITHTSVSASYNRQGFSYVNLLAWKSFFSAPTSHTYTGVSLILAQDKYKWLVAWHVAYTDCLGKFESIRLSARLFNLEFYKVISIKFYTDDSTETTMRV